MGLLPEFFMLLGIDIFLAMSLLSVLLDNDFPRKLQYLFQGAAFIGLGQLFISQGFINGGVFGRDPTDPTRFWVSIVYLSAAASSVVGSNIYLGFVRRRIALATAFSGTVTIPTVMTSLFFIYSFIDTSGDVALTPTTLGILGVSVAVSAVSMFGFLRQAARRLTGATQIREAALTIPSQTPPVAETEEHSVEPPNTPSLTSPFRLPAGREEEWEEAPRDEEGGETSV
jgi:hypothetical protein